MKNGLLKLGLISLLMGMTQLHATKMTRNISHGIPWIETRLAYSMTVEELAEMYYGNSEETNVILKMNQLSENSSMIFGKDMTVLVPVTNSFIDQPELLGWVQ
jgi:hypothetical protein